MSSRETFVGALSMAACLWAACAGSHPSPSPVPASPSAARRSLPQAAAPASQTAPSPPAPRVLAPAPPNAVLAAPDQLFPPVVGTRPPAVCRQKVAAAPAVHPVAVPSACSALRPTRARGLGDGPSPGTGVWIADSGAAFGRRFACDAPAGFDFAKESLVVLRWVGRGGFDVAGTVAVGGTTHLLVKRARFCPGGAVPSSGPPLQSAMYAVPASFGPIHVDLCPSPPGPPCPPLP